MQVTDAMVEVQIAQVFDDLSVTPDGNAVPWAQVANARNEVLRLVRSALAKSAEPVERPERVQAAFDVFKGKDDTGPNATALFEYIEHLEQRIRSALAEPAGEPVAWVANCCQCGRIVDTREEAQGGDKFGCELTDGRWTCSVDCWEAATGQPPAPTVMERRSPEQRRADIVAKLDAKAAAVQPERAVEALREAYTRTGVHDRDGREILAGDTIRINLESQYTKEEYWRPEYRVAFKAPSFVLEHIGGDKDSDTARWYFRVPQKSSIEKIETLTIASLAKEGR